MSDDPNAKFRNAVTPHNAVATWGLASNSKGAPLSTHANVGLVLDHMPEMLRGAYYDEFQDKTIVDRREWRDVDDTGLCMWLQEHIGLSTITPGMVHAVIAHRLHATPRHWVREYLKALPCDDLPRIAHAFEDHWGVEPGFSQSSDYIRAVSANFFIGLIARVMRPGCQLDTMVVFEGHQGTRKSSALRVLGGAGYMLATESINSKDFQQALRGAWIAEIGELESFSRADRDRIKAIISNPIDKYRGSYERHVREYPRQCLFAGTTNKDDWGNDDTGLRRFWPVWCGDIDLPGIVAHRDEWFAEAYRLYLTGASWWETPAAATLTAQRDRQSEDIWTRLVMEHLIGKSEVYLQDVLRDACKVREAEMNHAHKLRIGSILRLAGWTKSNRRRDGKQVKTWVAPDDE
jgi:putative DNA primase/helicase